MPWIYLALAVICEVFATSLLKVATTSSGLWPAVGVAVGYAAAFGFLALTLKTVPVGVAYAIWSGLGTVLVAAVGWVVFEQRLGKTALLGILLIVAGVALTRVGLADD